jgi:hypothetical protein
MRPEQDTNCASLWTGAPPTQLGISSALHGRLSIGRPPRRLSSSALLTRRNHRGRLCRSAAQHHWIGWPLPGGLGEEELESKLFGNQPAQAGAVQRLHFLAPAVKPAPAVVLLTLSYPPGADVQGHRRNGYVVGCFQHPAIAIRGGTHQRP